MARRHNLLSGCFVGLLLLSMTATMVAQASTITVGVLNVDNIPAGTYLATQTSTMIDLMQSTASIHNLLHYDYTSVEMAVTSNSATETAQEQVNTALKTHSVSYIEGGYPSSLTTFSEIYMDPIGLTPTLIGMQKNLAFLCPTVPQQLTIFAQYLSANKPSELNIISLTDASPNTPLNYLMSALKARGVTVDAVFIMEPNLAAATYISTKGINIILGSTDAMATDIATTVKSNNAKVLLLFDDLTMHFNMYSSVLGTTYSDVQDSIMFVSNLPPWTKAAAAGAKTDVNAHEAIPVGASVEGDVVPAADAAKPAHALTETDYTNAMNVYYADVPATSQTPAGLRAYLSTLVMNAAANRAGSSSSSAIDHVLFSGQTFAVGDNTYGPFLSHCIAPEENCVLNSGPSGVSLWTYGGMMQSNGKPLLANVNSALTSSGHFKDSYDNIFLWTILGVIALMLLLLLILLILCCCRHSADAASNTPDNCVTLIVVEIDDPETLRSVDADQLDAAAERLHQTVENLAERHDCRVVASSEHHFVVECHKAEAAVRFGCAVQEDARRQRSDAVADMYGDGEGSSGFVWSMLQVRVGMHSGHCERTPDAEEVQETDLEPCAAATSGLGRGGGQVLMTEATHRMLPSSADKNYHIEFFGEHAVGNNDTPMEIFVIAAPSVKVQEHEGVVEEEDKSMEENVDEATEKPRMNGFSSHEEQLPYQVAEGCAMVAVGDPSSGRALHLHEEELVLAETRDRSDEHVDDVAEVRMDENVAEEEEEDVRSEGRPRGEQLRRIQSVEEQLPLRTAEGTATVMMPCKRCSELYGEEVAEHFTAAAPAQERGDEAQWNRVNGYQCPCCHSVYPVESLVMPTATMVTRSTQVSARGPAQAGPAAAASPMRRRK